MKTPERIRIAVRILNKNEDGIATEVIIGGHLYELKRVNVDSPDVTKGEGNKKEVTRNANLS